MKKTYITPIVLTVELSNRDALLTSISATNETTGLGGTSYGGSSTSSGVTSGDVKESKSIWDEEW